MITKEQETELRELLLNGNKLSSLPYGSGKLINLELLNFSENQFSSIPSDICELVSLKTLKFASNNIYRVPDKIKDLINLKELDLRQNKLSESEKIKIKDLLPECEIKL